MEGDMQKFPHDWLKEKLGNSYKVPRTLSAEAIETLMKMKEMNLESDSDADQIIMYIEKLTDEVKSKDRKIQSALKNLGLRVFDLHGESKDELDNLITYQLKYHLIDLNKTTIVLDAVERMQKKAEEASFLAQLKREQIRLDFMTEPLQNQLAELEIQREEKEIILNGYLKEVNKQAESKEMSSEIEKNKTELGKLQMELNVRDYTVHTRVLDQLRDVDMVKTQIIVCQKELKKYKGLPPDFFQARKMLAETYNKLRDIDKEIFGKMFRKN